MRPILIAATAALAALAGCAQPGGDPCAAANSSISFGNLLSNSVSGSYGSCLDVMREDLAQARLRGRALEAEAAELRAEERRLRGERAAAAGRLAQLNERQAAALSQLSAADGARTVEQARLQALLAEERRLTDEIEALNARGGGASAAEAAALQQRQQRLQSQLRALLG